MTTVFEVTGAIFSMAGALLFALGKIKEGYWAFTVSNASMAVFGVLVGMPALVVQMAIFQAVNIAALAKLYKVGVSAAGFGIFTVLLLAFFVLRGSHPDLPPLVEIVAAAFALTGATVMPFGQIHRIGGFAMFFVADFLYMIVGFEKGYWAFTAQAIFFLGTSSLGIYRELRSMKKEPCRVHAQ